MNSSCFRWRRSCSALSHDSKRTWECRASRELTNVKSSRLSWWTGCVDEKCRGSVCEWSGREKWRDLTHRTRVRVGRRRRSPTPVQEGTVRRYWRASVQSANSLASAHPALCTDVVGSTRQKKIVRKLKKWDHSSAFESLPTGTCEGTVLLYSRASKTHLRHKFLVLSPVRNSAFRIPNPPRVLESVCNVQGNFRLWPTSRSIIGSTLRYYSSEARYDNLPVSWYKPSPLYIFTYSTITTSTNFQQSTPTTATRSLYPH